MKKFTRIMALALAFATVLAVSAVTVSAADEPQFIAWNNAENKILYVNEFEGDEVTADGMPKNTDKYIKADDGVHIKEGYDFDNKKLPYGFTAGKGFTVYQSKYGWYRCNGLGLEKSSDSAAAEIRTAYMKATAGKTYQIEAVLWFVKPIESKTATLGMSLEFYDKDLNKLACDNKVELNSTGGDCYNGSAVATAKAPEGTAYVCGLIYASKETLTPFMCVDCLAIKEEGFTGDRVAVACNPSKASDADAAVAKEYADAHKPEEKPEDKPADKPEEKPAKTGDEAVVFALIAVISLAGVTVARKVRG